MAVYLIPESDNPEDDKIYLFFKENAMDGEHAGKATHARIGQLCKVCTHALTNSHISMQMFTQAGSKKKKKKIEHTQKERDNDTHTFTQTLCEMGSISGKALHECLSGFHNGRFQGLLSVIIFSLAKNGLCCVWYNRP